MIELLIAVPFGLVCLVTGVVIVSQIWGEFREPLGGLVIRFFDFLADFERKPF